MDDEPYEKVHRKASDTFDRLDRIFFKTDTTLVAVIAYVLAAMPQPLAQQLDRADVREILKKKQNSSNIL